MLKLTEANIERQKEWGGDQNIDLLFRAVEVAGEFGELMEAIKKYTRSQRGIDGSTASLSDIKDELGDCFISLDLLATSLGINSEEAYSQKFNKTSDKYGFKTKI